MPRFKLTYETVDLTLKQPFGIARGTKTEVSNVFVHLFSGEIEGLGEAAPNVRYGETAETVSRFLDWLPGNFFDGVESPEALKKRLDEAGSRFCLAGSIPSVQSGKAAVEMAWLDWWGKSEQKPLWKLWGAPSRRGPATSYTIGLDDPKVMQRKISEADGFPVLKIKLGTERDREIIEAIREVTDKPLRVDANEGWTTVDRALRAIDFLSTRNVELIEQPMPAGMAEEMNRLKEASPVPLCADESFEGEEDLEQIARCFDMINIKLAKTGSLTKATQIIGEARKVGLKIMVGCMIESSLANTAGAIISLWSDYADLDGHLLIKNDPYDGLELDEGKHVMLNNRPGLGVRIKA